MFFCVKKAKLIIISKKMIADMVISENTQDPVDPSNHKIRRPQEVQKEPRSTGHRQVRKLHYLWDIMLNASPDVSSCRPSIQILASEAQEGGQSGWRTSKPHLFRSAALKLKFTMLIGNRLTKMCYSICSCSLNTFLFFYHVPCQL